MSVSSIGCCPAPNDVHCWDGDLYINPISETLVASVSWAVAMEQLSWETVDGLTNLTLLLSDISNKKFSCTEKFTFIWAVTFFLFTVYKTNSKRCNLRTCQGVD